MITIDGITYRICGCLDNGFKLAVMDDATGIGRILVRDTLDGPWRLWQPGGGP